MPFTEQLGAEPWTPKSWRSARDDLYVPCGAADDEASGPYADDQLVHWHDMLGRDAGQRGDHDLQGADGGADGDVG